MVIFLMQQFLSLSHTIPPEVLGTILIITVWALAVSARRQIIWFTVFGIYSPLLFAVSANTLWIVNSCCLLLLWFLAKLIVSLFTKKIHLLHNAKTAMLIIIYFSLIVLLQYFWISFLPLWILDSLYGAFPFIFIIIVADKIFNEGFTLFSKGWWISFLEFSMVSWSVWWLLHWQWLKEILISYPWSLLLIFIINILIGRFTGLQLLEYFRFMPLIKKHFESDEE